MKGSSQKAKSAAPNAWSSMTVIDVGHGFVLAMKKKKKNIDHKVNILTFSIRGV